MGPLRASELLPFGMEGHGEVFRLFRDGELARDDELAVQYGPAELGFPPLCEALVDIRATLDRARNEIGIDRAADSLLKVAIHTHFPNRSWKNLISNVIDLSELSKEIDVFSDWLPKGKRSFKAEEAYSVRSRLSSGKFPRLPKVNFEWKPTMHFSRLKEKALLKIGFVCGCPG